VILVIFKNLRFTW